MLTGAAERSKPPTVFVAAHAWVHDLAGGSFKLATEFAESLAARGRRVHYLCCETRDGADGTRRGPKVTRAEERGVTVWRYRAPAAGGPAGLWGHLRGAAAAARAAVGEVGPPDCLNGHTPLQFAGAARGLRGAAGRGGRPVRGVYTVHSPFADEFAAECRGPFSPAVRMAAAVEGRNLRRADAVTGDSAYTLGRLRELYPRVPTLAAPPDGAGSVCPGWIETNRFRPAGDRAALRARLGEPWAGPGGGDGAPIFFTLRRLHRRMGLDLLIDAAADLTARGAAFRLLIGGGGPLRGELEARVAGLGLGDRVRFLGFVPDAALPDHYAAADCFVLPTRALECFGLIILESYAAGVPVVATPVAAIPELVRLAGPDWLADAATAPALADRMGAFLDGRLAATPAALRAVAERFDRPAGVSRLEAVCLPDAPPSRPPDGPPA